MFQIQLGNYPISVVVIPNGNIAFNANLGDNKLTDYNGKMTTYIDCQGITIVDNDSKDEEHFTFFSQVEYKKYPMLMEWLKSFNLNYNLLF